MNDELEIFEKQGFGHALGIGERPSLCVVDFVIGFDDADALGGGNIHAAIERTATLLEFCRAQGYPIAHTRVVFADDGSDHNLLSDKVPSLKELTETAPNSQIVPSLTPKSGELVIRKRNASAFFQTDYAGWLALQGADTQLIAGCTTSGCVRATAVDALGYGYKPIVVTDCVGDRAIGPHDASLFDMGQKYADLMTAQEVMALLGGRKRVAAE